MEMVYRYPIDINEKTSFVTVKDTTANVESEAVVIEVPSRTNIILPEGAAVYLSFADSNGNAITDGVVRIYAADAARIKKVKIAEAPVNAFAELTDVNKQYKIRTSVRLQEKSVLIVTLESATAAAKDNTKLLIRAEQEVF